MRDQSKTTLPTISTTLATHNRKQTSISEHIKDDAARIIDYMNFSETSIDLQTTTSESSASNSPQRRRRSETVSSGKSDDVLVRDPTFNRSLFLADRFSTTSNQSITHGEQSESERDFAGSSAPVIADRGRTESMGLLRSKELVWSPSGADEAEAESPRDRRSPLSPRDAQGNRLLSRFTNEISASSFSHLESNSKIVDIDSDGSDSEKSETPSENSSMKSLPSIQNSKSSGTSRLTLKQQPSEGRVKQPVKKESPFYVKKDHAFQALHTLDPQLLRLLEIELTDDKNLYPSDTTTFYPHDNGQERPRLDFEVIDGKSHPKSGTLAGLIDYLVAENGETDITFMNDFLMTYLYFSEPTDVARLLILRYLECKEKFMQIQEATAKKSSQKATAKDSTQPDWNSMVQLRILNIMRKWVDNHWTDFDKHKSLCNLMIRFLTLEVHQDPKKMIFVNSINQKLEDNVSWLHSVKDLDAALSSASLDTKISEAKISLPPPPTTVPRDQSPLSLSDINPDDLVNEFSLIEYEKFKKIDISEFFQQSWAVKDKAMREKLAPNLLIFINWFNHMAYGVASAVVLEKKCKERTEILKKFIYMALRCAKIRNFNTCYEIVAGLNLACISKLKKNWKNLPKNYLDVWQDLNSLVTNEGNYRIMRAELFEEVGFPPSVPVIPYLGMFLSDLTFIEDGNPTYVQTDDGSNNNSVRTRIPLINFSKFKMVADKFKMIEEYQKRGFEFKSNTSIRQWVECNWKVLSEAELYKLAKDCEASASGSKPSPLSNAAGSIRDLLSVNSKKGPALGSNSSIASVSKGRARSSSMSARASHLSSSTTAQDLEGGPPSKK